MLGDTVTGEAREVAKVYASLVREIRSYRQPFKPPVALISGGECTVTLPPGTTGRGGRCTEFLLSLALSWRAPRMFMHSRAIPMESTVQKATPGRGWTRIDGASNGTGISAREALDRRDSYGFFRAADCLIQTGPTRTNVNDYRVILIQ